MAKKILILHSPFDKDESLRSILENIHPLIITDDAPSAMDVLKNIASTVSAVILDMKSQQESIEVISEIKENYPNIPIIITRSHQPKESPSSDSLHKADTQIFKPFRSHDVLMAIEKYIKK